MTRSLRHTAGYAGAGLVLLGLYLTSYHHYLLFHSLTEIFCVVIACGIFMFAWNARRFLDNSYFLFIGAAYLFTGGIDTLHMLAYKGMGAFHGFDANLPTELWIAGRYMQSISLLLAPLMMTRRLKMPWFFLIFSLLSSLLLVSIFYWGNFPDCYVEARGMTPFKIVSEYVISFILVCSIGLLWKRRNFFDAAVLRSLIASIGVAVIAEVSFTHYISVYGAANLIGHLLRIVSFYFMYKAIIETGLREPYDLLFRSLKQGEAALRAERDKFQKYIDIAGVITVVIGADQKVVLISRKGCEMLGYTPGEVIGKNWFDHFVPEEVREETRGVFTRLISGVADPVEYFENTVLTRSGETRLIAWHNIVLEDDGGRRASTLSSGEDITEQRALQRELARLASFPELNPYPVLELDARGRIRYLNPATRRLFPDVERQGARHPFLLGFEAIFQSLESENNKIYVREVRVGDKWYQQAFMFTVERRRIHIYSMDVTTRKMAEEKLKESGRRMGRAQEIAHLGSWELDLVNNALSWSDEVYRIFGLRPGEFRASYEAFLEAVHPDDRAAVDAAYSGSLREGRNSYEMDHRIVRKNDGDVRFVHEKCEHLRDASGRVIRSVGMVHDITERKRFEQALADSQVEISAMIENVPVVILLVDSDKRIRKANVVAEKFSKRGRDEMNGQRTGEALRCLHALDSPGGCGFGPFCEICPIRRSIEDTFQRGINHQGLEASIPFEEDGKRNTLTFLISTSLVVIAEERLCLVCMEDISARKQAEEGLRKARDELEQRVLQRTAELREMNEILEKIFSSTHFSIVYLDTRFNFIRVNKTYADAYGHPPEFFIGKNHFDLYPHDENRAIFEQAVRTGRPYSVFAKPFVYPNHPERGVNYWDWSLLPVKDAQGRTEGLVFCLVDVTKRKLAEEELGRTQKQLVEAKRLSDIGTLAATVAHELRNPLAAIHMTAFNLYRKAKDASLEKYFAIIEKKIDESDQIINNLLFYSRIKPPRHETVNIHEILEECSDVAESRHTKQDGVLKKDLDRVRGILIAADPLQLKEVFSNIINNAYDALQHQPRRTITLAGDVEKPYVRISCRDTGSGIDEDDLRRIFDPFFTTKAKGTGLGLTVCKQIISFHEGLINVASKKGQGTEIVVRLPIKRDL